MAEILNTELNKYWALLDTQERQSILSVMKSFLRLKLKTAEETSGDIYTEEFIAELRQRREDFLAGGEVYTMEESLRRIDKILSGENV